ncbi:MAG: acyl-CoA dehydrogenase family protein [Candidatus Calescibacterium sp.]|nr:acyl-CoA dehydrogenase family protein [Candidatus Calescibacterium sp.]MCX7733797.1 acyl-CoA dehydrogenase family protein [bacterium]MDW8086997.1 acyl-CoA dehydrogenase family protein [Candidatus Calescibacterium sp.]
MVDFTLTKEDKKLLEMIRFLGEKYMRPLGIEYDKKGEPIPPDHEFFKFLAQIGYQERVAGMGRELEDSGKTGGERTSARRAVLIGEETSYWDRGVAVALPGPGLAGPPLSILGTPEQKEKYLSIFKDRENPHWGAFAMTEPGAGSDVARIKTRCVKKNGKWIINGQKAFCSNADRADFIVVWATVDPKIGRAGHRAFVVEKGTPGLILTKIEKKMGLSAYSSCSLTLEDCEVPEENLLGGEKVYEEKTGFKSAMKSFNATRPTIAAMAIGIARAAYDWVQDFIKQNYIISRPIPRYQKINENIAKVRRYIEVGRMLCWKAAWMADKGMENIVEASQAKAFCPAVAQEAVSLCLDVMQDAGIQNDNYVEKLYRDVKALDIVEGTGQIQRVIIARRLFGLPSEDS